MDIELKPELPFSLGAVSLYTAIFAFLCAAWIVVKRKIRREYKLVGHVSSLYVYPIKSCAGVPLKEASCTELGIMYDRRWVIIDEKQKSFVSQRQEPSLCLVKPYFKGDHLYASAPGMATDLKLDLSMQSSEKRDIDIFGTDGEGVFAGEEAAEWISEYLKKPDMVIYLMDNTSRPRMLSDVQLLKDLIRPSDKTGFSDFSAYMVLSESSLSDLNTRVKSPKSVKNFRPNIVVSDSKAYDEDNWKHMTIGGTHFTGISNCTRCVLTAVDPESGVVDKTYDALKTLRGYRLHSDRKRFGYSPCFGFHYGIDVTGVIKVGDPIFAVKK